MPRLAHQGRAALRPCTAVIRILPGYPMNKTTIVLLLSLPLAFHAAPAAAQQACPALPGGSPLRWEQQAGDGFEVCRAMDAEGRQVFGLMLTEKPTVRPQRSHRVEEGTIGRYEMYWYRPAIAQDTVLEKRITVVELDDGRYAQFWVDAEDPAQLQSALSLAQGIALN